MDGEVVKGWALEEDVYIRRDGAECLGVERCSAAGMKACFTYRRRLTRKY
jgi:hypothetical protein